MPKRILEFVQCPGCQEEVVFDHGHFINCEYLTLPSPAYYSKQAAVLFAQRAEQIGLAVRNDCEILIIQIELSQLPERDQDVEKDIELFKKTVGRLFLTVIKMCPTRKTR